MYGNEQDLKTRARAFRIVLLMSLLLSTATAGCDLIDVLSIPGKSGGSINLYIPLGLGGNTGILNPAPSTSTNGTTSESDGGWTSGLPLFSLLGGTTGATTTSVTPPEAPAVGTTGGTKVDE